MINPICVTLLVRKSYGHWIIVNFSRGRKILKTWSSPSWKGHWNVQCNAKDALRLYFIKLLNLLALGSPQHDQRACTSWLPRMRCLHAICLIIKQLIDSIHIYCYLTQHLLDYNVASGNQLVFVDQQKLTQSLLIHL